MPLAGLLSNLTICCTGLEEELRISLQKKVEALNGRYSAHLTKECTHLIVGTLAKSQKYKSALKFGIPVVHVSWIDECWNMAHLNSGPVEEQSKLLRQMALKKYSVGGLHGCLVSVTGVAFEERAKICAMVQELGGLYSPELKPQCTHLIYEEDLQPQTSNHTINNTNSLPIKVQYALKWDIPVVDKSWIQACFSQKILLEESDFLPISISQKLSLISQDDCDGTEILPIKLSEIKEDTPAFLSNCHIYLNGDSITLQRLAVLKRLVLAAGAVRYTELDPGHQLTHIVIHNQLLPNSLKGFLDLNSEVKLVHDAWLFDSFKERKRLPEDDYEVIKRSRIITSISSNSQPQQKWKSAFASAANTTTSNSSFLNANPNSSFITRGGEEFLAGTPNVMESAAKILKEKCIFFAPEVVKVQKLTSKARRAGITIVSREVEADWCITSVIVSGDQFRRLTTHRSAFELRNEIWFEAALDSKSNLPPMSFAHPITSTTNLPISSLNPFIISQSGFTGPEREFYAEVIKASGAKYTDSLSKSNTHLLIAEPRSGTKFEFAKKWKIECISVDWFKAQFSLNSTKENTNTESSTTTNSNSYSYNSQILLSQAKLTFQTTKSITSTTTTTTTNTLIDDSDLLFKGLVFSSSQRLWHRRDELSSVIESLGGIFLWSFDRNCTHYLHQGNLVEEAFKEFKQARQWGKFIVSPWWILKCKESGSKVDESLYPHTYKDTTIIQVDDPVITAPEHADTKKVASNSLDWDAIMADRKAQEYLLRPGSKVFNIDAHMDSASDFIRQRAKSLPSTQSASADHHRVYEVVFSGYSSSEKGELLKSISELEGFKVVKEEAGPIDWNPKKAILICNTLNFTEKIFSACATGCWILKKEFLLEATTRSSIDTSLFEKYELGPAWNANERDLIIGRAPKYWRKRLSIDGNDRPFKDWRCALIVEASRQGLYETVLRNGGAQVIDLKEGGSLSANEISSISHFFCANIKAIPSELRTHLKNEQIFTTKHITNVIFRLSD